MKSRIHRGSWARKTRTVFWTGWLVSLVLLAGGLEAGYKKPSTVPVDLKVDFGPAEKPAFNQTIEVEKDSTPKDAVSLVYPVLSGRICTSLHEVLAIDGIRPEPKKNRWWICLVNGSRGISPYRTKLKKGDRVEWRYIEEVHAGPNT